MLRVSVILLERRTFLSFSLACLFLVGACNEETEIATSPPDAPTSPLVTPTPKSETTPIDVPVSETPEAVTPTPVDDSYDIPLQPTAPWAKFRRSSRNNGRSPIAPTSTAGIFWEFATEKGIFHAPVIDAEGRVYIGSADTRFYAINPDGTERWRFPMSELVDSTAVLSDDDVLYVPGGDGYLHALDLEGKELWKLPAMGSDGYITWWEGHAAMQHDGTLILGNDDYHVYAVSPDGEIQWTFTGLDQVWSCAAIGPDDEIYIGGNDMTLRSLSADGVERWSAYSLGPVASSPALSNDGSFVVVGSFDGFAHAYDSQTGRELWTFPARDHFYSSPALGPDGTTYLPSADGTVYALARDGSLKWAYDTLDPIRSSPAMDAEGNLYFGGGDGRIYALRSDGSRAWSFDTSTSDRNDLNGSPAIGYDGIVIGGEAGIITHLPFHYCESSRDARCSTEPGEDIPPEGEFFYYLTSGGSSVIRPTAPITPMEVLTFRLVVREKSDTVYARIDPSSLRVSFEPAFPFRTEVSASGQFLSVIPEVALQSGRSYTVKAEGDYLTGGVRVGNKVSGGRVAGSFDQSLAFDVAAETGHTLALEPTQDAVKVLHLRRMAAPQPPMLTSLNQIGFDSYNYLIAVLELEPSSGRIVTLAVEGTPGLTPTLNPETRSIFALNGDYEDAFLQIGGGGFALEVTGVSIAMDLFRLAGQLEEDLTADNLNLYAEVTCANVEFFGPILNLLGLCSEDTGKMIVNGTAMFQPHRGSEGLRPEDVEVASLTHVSSDEDEGLYGGGYLEARFSGSPRLASDELPIILLIDPSQPAAVELSYGADLEKLSDVDGTLTGVRLHLSRGFDPSGYRAVVLLNLFPLAESSELID